VNKSHLNVVQYSLKIPPEVDPNKKQTDLTRIVNKSHLKVFQNNEKIPPECVPEH
jgi:hypothetical protein